MEAVYVSLIFLFGCAQFGETFIFDSIFKTTTQRSKLPTLAPIIDPVAYTNCPKYINRKNHLMFNIYTKHCFQINTDRKADWLTAKRDCEGQGGHLAEIKSWSDESFLGFRTEGVLGYEHTYLWIGLSDREREGSYQWVTGDTLNSSMYSVWDKNEPSQGIFSNCAAYNQHNDKWSVHSCLRTFAWICQFDQNSITTSKVPTTSTTPTPKTTKTTPTRPSTRPTTKPATTLKPTTSAPPKTRTTPTAKPSTATPTNKPTTRKPTRMPTTPPTTSHSSTPSKNTPSSKATPTTRTVTPTTTKVTRTTRDPTTTKKKHLGINMIFG